MTIYKITGLVIEINKFAKGKKIISTQPISPKGIAKIIGISYAAVLKKIKNNFFTVEEAFKIKETLFPDLTLDYLFKEQML